ncbi:MAG: hypothetical protein Q8J88_00840 [Bacteroidales bacterium]|nr:hypothetical protein [Bacteroidales bacterium]
MNAQETQRQHKGLYLSLGLGPVFGNIEDFVKDNTAGDYTLSMSGVGINFDFKIGGAVQENLILHATVTSSALPGPTITIEGNSSIKASDNMSVGEAMIGAGATYYFMPSNIFISGSAGIGNFSIINEDEKINISTDRGLSFQLKAGKEWWISKKWGMGIALTYGKTNLTNNPEAGLSEKLDSNRFAILLNASFN